MATNGHIIIRVPRIETIPERTDAPKVLKMFEDASDRVPYEWFDIPEVTVKRRDCRCCDDCDGFIEMDETVRFTLLDGTEVGFANVYLKLINANLPDAKLGVGSDLKAAAKIKFKGGEGLLMPRKL